MWIFQLTYFPMELITLRSQEFKIKTLKIQGENLLWQ